MSRPSSPEPGSASRPSSVITRMCSPAANEVGSAFAVAGARGRARHHAFGAAERVDDRDAGQELDEPGLVLGAEAHAGRDDRAQRAQGAAVAGLFQLGDDRPGERVTDDPEHRDLFALDDVEQRARVEARFGAQHDRAPTRQRLRREAECGPVHQWRRGQERRGPLPGPHGVLGIRRYGPGPADLPAHQEVVLDAPDDALGHSRRATGVEQHRVVG